jgi:uncharacterized protein YerC
MTNISKRKLASEHQQELAKQFTTFVRGNLATNIFSEFFTEAEQVMLTKRLAAIAMLHNGYGVYRVAQSLHLSDATVMKYRAQYVSGRYSSLVKRLESKAFNQKRFWKAVEVILRAGLPPMAGPGRWKSIAPAAVRKTNK